MKKNWIVFPLLVGILAMTGCSTPSANETAKTNPCLRMDIKISPANRDQRNAIYCERIRGVVYRNPTSVGTWTHRPN